MTGYISLAPPASHNNNKKDTLSTSHTEFHLLSTTSSEKQEAGGVQVCTLHHLHGTQWNRNDNLITGTHTRTTSFKVPTFWSAPQLRRPHIDLLDSMIKTTKTQAKGEKKSIQTNKRTKKVICYLAIVLKMHHQMCSRKFVSENAALTPKMFMWRWQWRSACARVQKVVSHVVNGSRMFTLKLKNNSLVFRVPNS